MYIYVGSTTREDRDPSSSRTRNPSVLFGIALSYHYRRVRSRIVSAARATLWL